MKNTLNLHVGPLEKMLMEMSPAELRQIMMDHSDYEQTGVQGDTLLRETSGRCYRALQQRESGFDAVYMTMVGAAAHKVANIRTLNEAEDIEAADRAWETASIARRLAEMGDLTDADLDSLRDLQQLAREAMGIDGPSESPAP